MMSGKNIDKRKKNKEKQIRQKEKRKEKKHMTATKASMMLGLGPIDEETMEHFYTKKKMKKQLE